jgi:hypothetical protein
VEAQGDLDFTRRLDVMNEMAIAMFSLSSGLIRWSWLQRTPAPRVGIRP